MPAYTYEAQQADGRVQKGVLTADSARAARAQLRAQSLIPLAVAEVAQKGGQRSATRTQAQAQAQAGTNRRSILQMTVWQSRAFSGQGLAVWTEQLAALVNAGLPLERALQALSDQADKAGPQQITAQLRAEVNAGQSFSQALAQHPREFSAIYCAVVGAGEHSGHLGSVLDQLARDLQEQQALRAKLWGAALYPLIVSIVALLIVVFLMSYVVPQVAQVFMSSNRTLPLLTRFMLGASSLLRSYGWLLLMAAVLAAVGGYFALQRPKLRIAFDASFLRWPLVGRLARDYNGARFGSTLAMLCASGVPMLSALQAAAQTLSNRALRQDAEAAWTQVREGAPLSLALSRYERFPALLPMFARLGEQTGQLPAMLSRVALQIASDVQRRALALATILEPVLILAMGLLVMLIVLAVLMPIIELNQLAR